MSKQLRLVIIGLLIPLAFVDACTKQTADIEKPPEWNTEFVEICSITKDLSRYDGTIVRVRSLVKGFEELVLYSNDCPGESNLILADIDFDLRKELIRLSTADRRNNGIRGEIFLTGRLKKDAGKLVYYDQQIDRNGNAVNTKVMTVSKLSHIQIEQFIPTVSSP
ncbi:MAG: hypothetical protein ABI857_03765 [Acidobacteriota bacterium]